jgi:hypothetical protein
MNPQIAKAILAKRAMLEVSQYYRALASTKTGMKTSGTNTRPRYECT